MNKLNQKKPRAKAGPKTKWGRIDPIKVAALAGRLGATDAELAAVMGVTSATLYNWKKQNKELFDTLKAEKAKADGAVVKSLFWRATGYSHPAVKIVVVKGKPKKVPYIEHYPPDTTACIYWLKNRDPERWRDRIEQAISNPDGSPVAGTTVIAPSVVFVQPEKQPLPADPVLELPSANGNGGHE